MDIDFIKTKIQEGVLNKYPYEHLIIDNFLPFEFANDLYKELINIEKLNADNEFISDNGIKREFKQKKNCFDKYNAIIDLFGSNDLTNIIEKKFNLDLGLLSGDNSFDGGGYVISPPNSYLKYHIDFNFSNKIKKYRILNLILYMNLNYDNNGGELHLLNSKTKTVEAIAQPLFNRAVLFLTNKNTPHGVNINREGFYRRSINVYYYSDKPINSENEEPHKTIWLN